MARLAGTDHDRPTLGAEKIGPPTMRHLEKCDGKITSKTDRDATGPGCAHAKRDSCGLLSVAVLAAHPTQTIHQHHNGCGVILVFRPPALKVHSNSPLEESMYSSPSMQPKPRRRDAPQTTGEAKIGSQPSWGGERGVVRNCHASSYDERKDEGEAGVRV